MQWLEEKYVLDKNIFGMQVEQKPEKLWANG